MSSKLLTSFKRRAVLLGFVALAGCGFTPVYGTGGAARVYWQRVAFETPADADGFALRQRLQDRLGIAAEADYRLIVTLDFAQTSAAIGADNSASRLNIAGKADYVLRDSADNVIATGTVESFTGYSNTGTTVATRAAELDARQRLVDGLADKIVTRLFARTPAT